MKWYSIETCDRALRDGLRAICRRDGIEFEISSAGTGWHIAVLVDKDQARDINLWLARQ